MLEKHVHVLMGMFGSGKTEISLNLAACIRQERNPVAIVDADIVSPYFRSRDLTEVFAEDNVEIIAPKGAFRIADLPTIPARVRGVLQSYDYSIVVDAGGNDYGAVVLSSISGDINVRQSAVYFVINPFRPFTDTVNKTVEHLSRLSRRARLRVDYLINNANLGNETAESDILTGERFVEAVSEASGIPVAMTCVMNGTEVSGNSFPLFRMKKYLKTPWEV